MTYSNVIIVHVKYRLILRSFSQYFFIIFEICHFLHRDAIKVCFPNYTCWTLKSQIKLSRSILDVKQKAVRYWFARWQENEDLSKLPKTSRSCATSKKTDLKIVNIATSELNITLNDISNILKNDGVNIDPSTVRCRLRESGGTYSPPLKKPLLTEKYREQRLTQSISQLGQRGLY